MSSDIPNDGAQIIGISFPESGTVGLEVSFPVEDRAYLSRVHTFYIGSKQEEFGAQVLELQQLAEELAFEVLHGYSRQPKVASTDD